MNKHSANHLYTSAEANINSLPLFGKKQRVATKINDTNMQVFCK